MLRRMYLEGLVGAPRANPFFLVEDSRGFSVYCDVEKREDCTKRKMSE